jgi:hypothetical protein
MLIHSGTHITTLSGTQHNLRFRPACGPQLADESIGSVSKMISSKGSLAAAKTTNLGFSVGHFLSILNV